MSRAELEALRDFVQNLIEQKRLLDESPPQIERLIEEYQLALGRQGGDEWTDPAGNIMLSYPRGAVVARAGSLWSSARSMNMSTPGSNTDWVAVEDGETE